MQRDISKPSTSSGTTIERGHGARMGAGEMPSTDYISSAFGSAGDWVSQTGSYIGQQIRERPYALSFMLAGIIGSIVGIRVAQLQAYRRSAFRRAMDTLLGMWVAFRLFGRPKRPMDVLMDRGKDFMGATREMQSSMRYGMPRMGRFYYRPSAFRGPESFFTRAGYAISLIPVVLAFMRNPLIRGFAFRYMGRRFIGR